MGKLLKEAAAHRKENPTRRGPQCDTCKLLNRASPSDRADLEVLIAGDDDATWLAKYLTSKGMAIGYWSIQRHRRGHA